jgi:CDP-diacylglycerol pyrophosphatase
MTTTARPRRIRRLALIAAAAAMPMLGLGLSPAAGATTPAPFDPCDSTPSSTNDIWAGVNPTTHTPKFPGLDNAKVVWPNGDSSRGYAVKYGDSPKNHHDLLVVPTVRELGIECHNLLGDAPEYFTDGYT